MLLIDAIPYCSCEVGSLPASAVLCVCKLSRKIDQKLVGTTNGRLCTLCLLKFCTCLYSVAYLSSYPRSKRYNKPA